MISKYLNNQITRRIKIVTMQQRIYNCLTNCLFWILRYFTEFK